MANAIEFDHVSKLYRLGYVSTGALKDDLHRFWVTKILKGEDPYLKIGATNDRTTKGDSDYVWALKDIDFKVEQGDVVGIIGKNGAGKSTLLKLLSRVTGPTTGSIRAHGRIGSLLEVGTGFHPEMTGRENIFMNGAILGMTHREIQSKLDEIIDFSGCERYIDTPVKRYSSGMMVRLGFAVAAHLEPEILVVDEVLAVGDAEFQKKAIGKMKDVSNHDGRTVLFVSHNMTSVRNLCRSGIVLENGSVSFRGTSDEAVTKYLAINTNEQTRSISERKDRFGHGKIKVKDIKLKNINGEVVEDTFVGEYLKIEFYVEAEPDVDFSKMIATVKLTDNFGTETVMWVSDEMGTDFSKIKDGVFSLEIPKLNMRPNIYNLYYKIDYGSTSQKDTADNMNAACLVSVVNNNFYTTNIPLKEGRGYIPVIDAKYTV